MLPESALLLIRKSQETRRSKRLLGYCWIRLKSLPILWCFSSTWQPGFKILDDVVESSAVSVKVMSRPIRWLDLECQAKAHLSSRRTLLRKRRA